jgi:hypothetical protein
LVIFQVRPCLLAQDLASGFDTPDFHFMSSWD